MKTYPGLDVQSDLSGLFPYKSRFVDVGGGVQQAVVDEGPRDAPLTFVCLHGNPTWGLLYRRFIEQLAPRYRVVVPDHVGFGRSDKPDDPSYYTLERHITNLERTLEALDVRNAVPVIQDWGGPIGMGWATRHSERVAGVVVLNTWAFVREPEMKLPWLFKAMLRSGWGQRRIVQDNFFTEMILFRMASGKRMEPRVQDAYRAQHPTPQTREGIAAFPRMIPETANRQHPAWETMAEIEDGLARLRSKPALICWAMKDMAFRKPQLDRWTRAFARVDGPHRLPTANHYLQEDAPEEILAHMERWATTVTTDAPAQAR